MSGMNRRDFMKHVAALAALSQLPGLPAAVAQIEKDEELLALLRELGKHEDMTVYRASPLNAGSPLEPLRATQETPADIFYLRNHAPVPALDADSWRLEVDGLVERPLSLSLADLQRDFPRHELEATLQCAGFRRQEMLNEENAYGALLWCSDAISNGRWGGVRLRDVLEAAGVQGEAQHLAALGLDEIEEGRVTFGFGGSIPLHKALGEELLLAYELNGAPLPAAHGWPLRLVVPGYIGARSVKWLGRLTLQAGESDNYYQQRAYKVFPPDVESDMTETGAAEPLGDLVVNSVFITPAADAELAAGPQLLRGIAIASQPLAMVELSLDGGESWQEAGLSGAGRWSWRFWEAEVELAPGDYELVVRARDQAGNVQPPTVEEIWNFKGYMTNHWQRRSVTVR
ncbi:MAG: sulfite oxidase [Anaerolineaceae bacterium]|nr:sulfite oxidase [Anaerolineaceae bacterium]